MSPGYKEFEHFFRNLHKNKVINIPKILKAVNNKIIKILVEIAYNLIKGNIPLRPVDIRRLKKYKKVIKRLITKRLTLNTKRTILEHNSQLIKDMLNAIFYV